MTVTRAPEALTILLRMFALAALVGCYGNSPFRTNPKPAEIGQDCAKRADPEECSFVLASSASDAPYVLNVVEFDDQGAEHELEGARPQLQTVLGQLSAPSSPNLSGNIVVAFAHGWWNNARPGNENLDLFAKLLEGIAHQEVAAAAAEKRAPRRVMGVYLAWRGAISTRHGVDTLFSFWTRKDAAHRIGERAAGTALIAIRNAVYASERNGAKSNRFIVLAHSFGAALVYSALSPLLADTFLDQRGSSAPNDLPRVADAVVLLNPAFESARLNHLLAIAGNQTSRRGPTLAILTAKSDSATKFWFPLGRGFNTILQRYKTVQNPVGPGSISERKSNRTAPGHFQALVTHDLRAMEDPESSPACNSSAILAPGPAAAPAAQQRQVKAAVGVATGNYAAGTAMPFGATCLAPRERVDQPALGVFNVSMHNDVWKGHGVNQDTVRLARITSFLSVFIPFAAGLVEEPATDSASSEESAIPEGQGKARPALRNEF